MTTKSVAPRRLGIPIDCTEHDRYCTMSLGAFDTFSRARITVQRSLLPVGAKLGRPLDLADGFQEFELLMPTLGAGDTAGAETSPDAASSPAAAPTASDPLPNCAAADADLLPKPQAAHASAALEQLAPVRVVAPTGRVDRQVVATRLRSCPDDVRIDGTIVPWGRTAPLRPPAEPRAPAPPIVLEHVGRETLLLANGNRYRSVDAEAARCIPLGTPVIVHRGEEQRRLVAGADAFRLQLELFTQDPAEPEAPP